MTTLLIVIQFLYISQEISKTYMNSYGYLLLDILKFYSSQRFRNPKYFTEDSIVDFVFTLTNK